MAPNTVVAVTFAGMVMTGAGVAFGASLTTPVESLRPASAFDSITNETARSRALFEEAARVITHPRCMNCHPVTRTPAQGDDRHPHIPFFDASASDHGPDGLRCAACHGPDNRTILGSRLTSIPGNPHWSLAPQSMGWQGLSPGDICKQLKDPARNGGRSLTDLIRHANEDHLVAWAWHPGQGRTPAPGDQATFGALVAAWIGTGAVCPE